MKIERHHYNPTVEQRAELKRHAAEMRGRVRAMRNLRDTASGYSHMNVGAQQSTRRAAREPSLLQQISQDFGSAHAAFRSFGWSDSAAGELAAIAHRMEAMS